MVGQLLSTLKQSALPESAFSVTRRHPIIPQDSALPHGHRSERGVTLIETTMAALILIIVAVGLLPVFIVGTQTTYAQGDVATRVTEYAQDKMEQLLSLNKDNIASDGFNDGQTDTTVFPAAVSGYSGTTSCTGVSPNICGLGGSMNPNSTVGSVPPAAPVTYFVDYLDSNGNLLTSSTGAYYTRQWSVSTDSTGNLKTITIVVTTTGGGVKGAAPSAMLVSIKAANL